MSAFRTNHFNEIFSRDHVSKSTVSIYVGTIFDHQCIIKTCCRRCFCIDVVVVVIVVDVVVIVVASVIVGTL